jgi:hypothetical protein
LVLQEYIWAGEEPDLGLNRKAIAWEIIGLRNGRAWIAEMRRRWQILRAQDEVYEEWTGTFLSCQEL